MGESVRIWIEAARPRTLVAGIAPVVVGTAASGRVIAWRFVAAAVVALSLQVAVNFANDLFDATRGVDTGERLGPRRAVATGLLTSAQVKAAIAVCFAVAGAAGAALAAAVDLRLLGVGAISLLAALGYSGGPRPYGGAALGEVFVFVFFGLVATIGSGYVQTATITAPLVVASIPMGALPAAILVANNLRDMATDRRAGKLTLAVRLGSKRTEVLHRALIAAAFAAAPVAAVAANDPRPLLALGAGPAAAGPLRLIGRRDGPGLIAALVATARLEAVFALLLAVGLWLAR